MAITVKAKQAVSVEDQFAKDVRELFNQGERNVDVAFTLSENDPDDADWIKRRAYYRAVLEDAENAFNEAKAANDQAAMEIATKTLVDTRETLARINDVTFGRITVASGKQQIVKGSFLEKLEKAINALNADTTWLRGDVISRGRIDYDSHIVTLHRGPKSKRTRTKRTSIDAIGAMFDKAISAATESETE